MNEHNEQQYPSYEALDIIVRSVAGALSRAGVTECDDPGEAIDVLRERYERRIAELSQPAAAQEAVAFSRAAVEGALIDAGAQQKKPSLWTVTTRELMQVVNTLNAAAPVTAAPVELQSAARFAADVLGELYAKHQNKIGPFASQAQRANVMLGAALRESTPAAPGIDLTPFRQVAKFAKYWADEVGNDEVDADADRLLALIDASPKGGTPAFQVPAGWALVPDRMQLTPENMELLADTLRGADEAEPWYGGVLWVGQTTDDDGEPTYYGLNVGNVECLEEGSVNIVEFDPPADGPKGGSVDGRTLAKARDAWMASDEARMLGNDRGGPVGGQYLRNRLEAAFCAGYAAASQAGDAEVHP